jgi:demethylmenaquinone methyltransferase/2-methoxy-6-polyprenyl-1,4-benzoquinol methylase
MTLPYKDSTAAKKTQVAEMFNNISARYDFLNHFLSLGIDRLWRKKTIRLVSAKQPKRILDVATGTADFAFEALRLQPEKVVGIDISAGMLEVGKEKVKKRNKTDIIQLQQADSEDLPFDDASFDLVTVGFGVRNFENVKRGLSEMLRVLEVGGTAAILEFSKPRKFPVKQLYGFYFKHILPRIGRLVSKDKSAYTYLPESVQAFPEGNDFIEMLHDCGYKNARVHPVFFGVASIYLAEK